MTFRNDPLDVPCFPESSLSAVATMRRLPQARDFARLRRLLAAVADGFDDGALIGRYMGAGPRFASRHAAYYRVAAEVLGLIEHGSWTLTRRGSAVLASRAESDEERGVLRAAIAGASELGELAGAILAPREPDVAALVERAIEALPRLSRRTIERRIDDTLSWRAYVYASSV